MSLKELKTTQRYISILEQNWINSLKDFFLYLPRTYEDRREIKTLSQLTIDNTTQTTKGTIINKSMINTPKGKKLFEIKFQDTQETVWKINIINNAYYAKQIQKWKTYSIVGKPKFQNNQIVFWNPKVIESDENNSKTGLLYPIYTELMGIKSEWFARKIYDNFDKIPEYFQEYLPEEILKEYYLPDIKSAIQNIHFPSDEKKLKKAKYRLYFEKLLKIQIISLMDKEQYQKKETTSKPDWDIVKEIINKLPFDLTKAQKKVIKQCIEDIESWESMMRLLQWDVGSWKTVVAVIVAYYIKVKHQKQTAILAPTEVLARQHFMNINKILLPLWINTKLLVGSTRKKEKQEIKNSLQNWYINIIAGTTAIIQEDINFSDLWFVVIDEQHKFWVRQRGYLKQFNSPHILQMTATPIPRSLALAFFGEFDVSTIDELPWWRKPIYTKIISEQEINKIKPWIMEKIKNNQQVYIVTPLIEESQNLDEIASATEEYEETKNIFNEIGNQIWILHWKLKPEEKDEVMNKFKDGKLKILVTTTVIEVGVDVPQATIMIIKNCERFGLSQLHQLRGRVGRSSTQSYCLLTTKSNSKETLKRLKAMEKYTDGFKLSEIDLETRGYWEILGYKQSWEMDIPTHILTNEKLLENIQEAAKKILKKHPNLEGLEWLKNQINKEYYDILS